MLINSSNDEKAAGAGFALTTESYWSESDVVLASARGEPFNMKGIAGNGGTDFDWNGVPEVRSATNWPLREE
jgi:hypothetical protein